MKTVRIVEDPFQHYLRNLEASHLLRTLRTIEARQGVQVTLDNRELTAFASNDYLGLSTHPAVNEAAIAAIHQWGVGAGSARLISGTTQLHTQLEKELAQFKGVEAALTFGSGFSANIGLISTVIDTDGIIFADRLSHASLIDGCRLSRADLRFFQHNFVEDLEKLLRRRRTGRSALIVTEGVFSMDGDVAPLPDLVSVAQKHGAMLLVDDAHGTGVMGAHGRGTLEHFGVSSENVYQMGTLSKAIGTSGGYAVGSQEFIRYLINRARSFIYSTAPPPAVAAAALQAINIIQTDPERRTRLWTNRHYLYQGLQQSGFTLTDTQSPILPVVLSDPQQAVTVSQKLFEAGFFIPAIRPPTVPKGTSRLRITVSSEHTIDQLAQLLFTLRAIGEEMRIV